MATLVSACLLGFACRHDGRDKRDEKVLRVDDEIVPICPEVAGGLPTPRPPAWAEGARMKDANGRDVTAQFDEGARTAVHAARSHGVRLAILKKKSPSCDALTGRAALALKDAGVEVMSEDEL